MKNEKTVNNVIWAATTACFLLSICFEFKIDRFFVYKYCSWMSGHRAFIINILLGGFASGVITGITTWIALNLKKQSLEESVNQRLYEVRRYFNDCCDSIARKDYKKLVSSMDEFENAMTNFINYIYSNDFVDAKYKTVEEIYCRKIIQHSTLLITYDVLFGVNNDGDTELLFSDLSNSILGNVKDEFNKALDNILGKNKILNINKADYDIAKQMEDIENHYKKQDN